MSERSESLVPRATARAALVTCLTVGLLLSACGQKGPLTLASTPKTQPPGPSARPAAAAAAPAASPASAPPRTWGSPPP